MDCNNRSLVRFGRDARLARRDEGANRAFVTEEQRRQAERPGRRSLVEEAVDLHQLSVQDRGTRCASDRVVTERDELVVEHRAIS